MTAARPQHSRGSRPQHKRGRGRGPDGQGATFSFRVRERICEAHVELHRIVYGRVQQAKSRGGTASLEGLAAELRAVTDARRYAAAAHGPARDPRMADVRRALLQVAASALLLAEAADRPEEEAWRGEKSKHRQWFTPDFRMAA